MKLPFNSTGNKCDLIPEKSRFNVNLIKGKQQLSLNLFYADMRERMKLIPLLYSVEQKRSS